VDDVPFPFRVYHFFDYHLGKIPILANISENGLVQQQPGKYWIPIFCSPGFPMPFTFTKAVIEVDKNTLLRRLRGHGDAVTCAAFAEADKSRPLEPPNKPQIRRICIFGW